MAQWINSLTLRGEKEKSGLEMSESGDSHTIAESTRAHTRSRRPAGMEVASGGRERTHKDKAFIFRQIGYLHQQRTHSEYHLCYQLFAAIFSLILTNFEWVASSRLLNCELARCRYLCCFLKEQSREHVENKGSARGTKPKQTHFGSARSGSGQGSHPNQARHGARHRAPHGTRLGFVAGR